MTTLTKEKAPVKQLPDAELLWELFDYDPINGVLIWRVNPSNNTHVGDIAGHVDLHGYRIISVSGVHYKAHRLICKWVTGEEPSSLVEHMDDNPCNNCFWNLNPYGNDRTNNHTRYINANGECRGYSIRPNGKYQSRIMIGKEFHCLGTFDTKEEATRVFNNAVIRVNEDPSWRPSPFLSSSAYRWVSFHKSTGRWMASYRHKNKLYYVGLFDDEYEAYMAAVSHRANNSAILDSMIENFPQTGDALSTPSVHS